jgi:uncharacterized protein YjdB
MKNSKKLAGIITIIVVIAYLMTVIACDEAYGNGEITVTGVTLNKSSTYILVGHNEILTATVAPSKALNKDVTWISSNPDVATVTEGIVIGLKPGSAAITVTTVDGGKKAACAVTVSASSVAVTVVSLNKNTLSLAVNSTETLTAIIEPPDATNQNVTWSSSNTAVATVANGTVTGKATGTATITVRTEDGDHTTACSVTITGGSGGGNVAVTGVSLNKTSASIAVGGTETLSATVAPSNATNKNVTWSSNNTSVATVSSNGTVSGIAAGNARITVTTANGGKTATCDITITRGSSIGDVTGVSIDKPTLYLAVGTTAKLTETVSPANATNKAVKWSSANINRATVSENGIVTGKSAGDTIITVTTDDGGYTATCTVTVSLTFVSVTGVTLNKSATGILINATETLAVTIQPSNATNKFVTWSSSDSSVATVANGVITGKTAGNATITVTTEDGNKTASCTVEVSGSAVDVTGVSLNKSSANIAVGASETLTATINPTNATNQKVTWSTSNSAIASVDDNGKVTGVAEGIATITVTSADGGKTATCTVTIPKPPLSAATLATYLGTLSSNNPASSHEITLKINNVSDFNLIKKALGGEPGKYVKLYLAESTVTSIEGATFLKCATLVGITMPNAITSIGNSAFNGCINLISVTIPGTVTSIGNEAFRNCANLENVSIPNSVKSIGSSAFRDSVNAISGTLNIPNSTDIGSSAFQGCYKITSVNLNSVQNIGSSAFYGCTGLTSITIPSSVKSIRNHVFYGCTSLTSITIQGAVTSIGEGIFGGCTNLTNITIPESVTDIGNSAFQGCTSLGSITIPKNVSRVGDAAFRDCTSLTSVTFSGTIPSTGFSTIEPFPGDLRAKYYATDPTNGTPKTYTRAISGEWN